MGLTFNQSVYKCKQKAVKSVAKRKGQSKLSSLNKTFLQHLGLKLWKNQRKF